MVVKGIARKASGCSNMIIYKMTNKKNGKVYIGQTCRSLDERIREHARHRFIAIDKAIQKYGIEMFNVEVIDEAKTIDELNEKEIYWIKQFNCIVPNGYNMCNGGDNTIGFHHREESKRKMAESKSKMFIGENNPFYGKTHSEEQKKKWSEARKGLKHLTAEQIKHLRESAYKVKVLCVETGEVFKSIREASLKYNIKETHISRVCRGRRKRTGGFHWRYVD